jgi:broad specificity phosphatase PhoE
LVDDDVVISERFDSLIGHSLDVATAPPDASIRLYLVRHAQQDTDSAADLHSFMDAPRTPLGKTQAELLGRHLASRLDHSTPVIASGLQRAVATADAVAAALGTPRTLTDAGWREVELLRGVTDLEDAGATERWQAEGFSFVETGLWDAWSRAEPSEDLRARVVHAAKQSVRVGAGRPVVVCTHGGTINALLAELLGVARDYWIPLAHASISEVARCEGAGVVRSINDASYLPTSLMSF